MIFLIGSILASSSIFILFQLFKRFEIDTFQAIVFNYFTALSFGFLVYGDSFNKEALVDLNWLPFAGIAGILFIALFLLMGISSQRNGIASTSVAVKMSMGVSILLFIIWYNEPITLLKISGICFAFLSVWLMSRTKKSSSIDSNSSVKWMLIALFFGSGLLDFMLNYVQANQLKHLTPALFSAIGFGIAGCIGVLFLVPNLIQHKRKFEWKNVMAGICLGIPNFFSIYLLMASYQATGWNSSTVLAITNVSIVILTGAIGLSIFKEGVTKFKITGFVCALFAIALLYVETQLK